MLNALFYFLLGLFAGVLVVSAIGANKCGNCLEDGWLRREEEKNASREQG